MYSWCISQVAVEECVSRYNRLSRKLNIWKDDRAAVFDELSGLVFSGVFQKAAA